jgi:hypothetical protein
MDAIPQYEAIVYATLGRLIQIDEEGRIWRIGVRRHGIIKPCKGVRAENGTGSKRGYLQVRVRLNGKRYQVSAHRLVWMHFKNHGVPAPANLEVNHENGIKSDNRPHNLELMTGSENIKHAYRTGLKDQRGEKNPAAKLTNTQVAAIRNAYEKGDYTQAELSAMHGVTFQCISKIVRGARRSSNLGPTGDYTARRAHNKIVRDVETGQFRAA